MTSNYCIVMGGTDAYDYGTLLGECHLKKL